MNKDRLYPLLVIIAFFSLLSSNSCAQFNPATNSFKLDAGNYSYLKNIQKLKTTDNSTPVCIENSFWVVAANVINQFQIIGDSVIDLGFFDSCNSRNLAYCNDSTDGSPAFCSSLDEKNVWFYSDSGWGNAHYVHSNYNLYNAGGYGNYLYFLGGVGSKNTTIVRFIDTSLSVVYRDSDAYAVAGIAVDDSGNIWIGARDSIMSRKIDYIGVISPSGQMIKRYNITPIDEENAYGLFLLNNTLYIGFGGTNLINPNSLISFSFTQDSAIRGISLSMPPLDLSYDIASCNPGAPLSSFPLQITEPIINDSPMNFSIFPNPSDGANLFLKIDDNLIGQNAVITDIGGREIEQIKLESKTSLVKTEKFANGIYFITVLTPSGEIMSKKIIIAQ